MADFVFNIAKGKVAHYGTLPATNDALIAVPLEATGIETDAVMKDYADLASILAATTNEQTTMGRKTLASVASTVDNTHDVMDTDAADVTWVAATGNPTAKLLVCYDPDTTTGTDADLIPLVAVDFAATPSGGDITAQFAAADAGGGAGFFRAS